MPTKTFKEWIIFEIHDEEPKCAYITIISEEFLKIHPQTIEEADKFLEDLYKIFDPFIELVHFQDRKINMKVDMANTPMQMVYIKILMHIFSSMHHHIKFTNITERCELINTSIVVKAAVMLCKPFMRESFREKIIIS
jgi:hypothetical protein